MSKRLKYTHIDLQTHYERVTAVLVIHQYKVDQGNSLKEC